MSTILSAEACECLVRELSEHKRRFDPNRRYARSAGVWPPPPLTRRNPDVVAADARDRAAVIAPMDQPTGRHSGWTDNLRD